MSLTRLSLEATGSSRMSTGRGCATSVRGNERGASTLAGWPHLRSYCLCAEWWVWCVLRYVEWRLWCKLLDGWVWVCYYGSGECDLYFCLNVDWLASVMYITSACEWVCSFRTYCLYGDWWVWCILLLLICGVKSACNIFYDCLYVEEWVSMMYTMLVCSVVSMIYTHTAVLSVRVMQINVLSSLGGQYLRTAVSTETNEKYFHVQLSINYFHS